MFTKRIIPCLDVDRGRVVKGTNFVGLRDAGDPVEVARRYDEEGADELVFLDISASHEGRAIMLEMVRRVAEEIFMPFTVGGGIRTLDDATQLIQAGAEKVSLNSAAVKTPELIAQVSRKFGSCATVVNIDPRRVRKPLAKTSTKKLTISEMKRPATTASVITEPDFGKVGSVNSCARETMEALAVRASASARALASS